MVVIPSGACEVTIAQKKRSNNVLALRSYSLFFNSHWIVMKSGNYTYKDNAFSYLSPDRQNLNATEEIKFTTQLSQVIEACLMRSGS